MSTNNETLDSSEEGSDVTGNQYLSHLIATCALGDQHAFEKLYEKTSAQLFAVLRRMLQSDALAEEALQESYVKIWNNTTKYNSEKSQPRTWLVSIARYHAIDILRRRKIREDNELQIGSSDLDLFADTRVPFDKQFAESEQLTLCLDELNAQAKQCVIGAYCIGLSHEELSDNLEKPIGTIKSWLRRSLLSLKECLYGYA